MNDYITAEGKSLFLCACDLNNRIRMEMLFKSNFAVDGEVQFFCPTKDGKKWRAKLKYTYDDVSCVLISPKVTFSFLLNEGDSRESCMKNHVEETIHKQSSNEGIHIFNPQIIIPMNSAEKWQVYSMFCCPARKRHS